MKRIDPTSIFKAVAEVDQSGSQSAQSQIAHLLEQKRFEERDALLDR